MTLVYVLRHPETTWNAAERYQGRLESPVSCQGKVQSQDLAAQFEELPLDAVYCSPLMRARHLGADLQRITAAPLVIDERLTEIGQGVWEGLYAYEIRERYAELAAAWSSAPDAVIFPFGEALADVQTRALSVLDDIYAAHPTTSVAVVTHSMIVRVLVSAALDLDLRHIHRVPVTNASITTFSGTEAPGTLVVLNSSVPGVSGATPSQSALWNSERAAS